MGILERNDLAVCRDMFAAACKASRQHSKLATWALNRYGDYGPPISGCVRDHFPKRVKDTLRQRALDVTMCSMAAWDHRPKRIRHTTMQKLSRAVAQRDGSGYYGPQA